MKDVEIIEVIRTDIAVRGEGTREDPCRRITQFWSKDGNMLDEIDPVARIVTPATMRRILDVINPGQGVHFSREAIMEAMFGKRSGS